MAYTSLKDITEITFNSTDLKAYAHGDKIGGLAYHAVKDSFHAAGAVYPTNSDTGMRTQDDITITFNADGGASGPNVKCAMGTSSTLTITFTTGISITGTFWVSDVEYGVSPDGNNTITPTFTPTGTITWDLAA